MDSGVAGVSVRRGGHAFLYYDKQFAKLRKLYPWRQGEHMRIVHEVDTPMQVGGGGRDRNSDPGKYGHNGMRFELVICTDLAANHPDLPPSMFAGNREVIHIEGEAEYIVEMLQSALDCVSGAVELAQKAGPQRDLPCPNCDPETDYPNATHLMTCPLHPLFGGVCAA